MFNQVTEYNLAVSAQSEVGFFKVSVEVQARNFPTIELNEIVASKTVKDVINLQLAIPSSDEEHVTLALRNISGTSNIFLRPCKDEYCVQEKFISFDEAKSNSMMSHLEANYVTKSLTFQPRCLADKLSGLCHYIIGVVTESNENTSIF